ncbi:MAG: hypothetical protein OXG39_06795 [Chloroflexi bacterium]|nr:hypothetical protein [Chloroflexota bacterium]
MDSNKMSSGIIPGVIAGYVFLAYVGAGAGPARMGEDGSITITAANGMIDMVGGMIGSDAFVGFILHIVISLVIGALYTGFFRDNVYLGNPLMDITVGGLIYGLIWWIVGGNIIMPLIAGGDILQLSIGPSFYGHIIFGHVLAFLVVLSDQAFGLAYIDGRDYGRLPKRKHPSGFVYDEFDEKTGLDKIGRTIDPERR